ncbi:MAG: glycerol-3-phosphate dehydrogenase/oxidase [Candidatus Melainabacteria bacterium]|nr:glycerol-3-phosphate dehydrogenase/oxidase [Candidatus Melainabacteria bacterium]
MQSRTQALTVAREKIFDVAVIGGGIVGAGIAQNAASRGLSVILIDKGDFSSGTSSKTTKLIHGGLRYLEQFQFKLTKELCSERALLEQLAPHLIKDFNFVLPIAKGSGIFGLKAQAGLALYDLIAWKKRNVKGHHRLNSKEVVAAVPSIAGNKISGGLRFHDCITDDARLVLEVLKSAENLGAVLINYVIAQNFEFEGNRINALACRDRVSGQEFRITAKTCINATGVWSDGLMGKIDPDWKNHVRPAKGIHIMLPSSAFDTNTALFLPTEEGRYVFVIPWQRALLVGTTDTAYEGSLDNPLASEEEIQYLLNVVNQYSSENRRLHRADVIASWAGLRPLVLDVGKNQTESNTSNISREYNLFEGKGGILGLIGGKLTNYRIIADEAVTRVITKLSHDHIASLKPSSTDRIMLGGWTDKDDYLTTSAEISARARRSSIEPATIDHLIASYGKDALKVIELVEGDSYLNKRVCPDFPPIMAEVVYNVKFEMALCLEDILYRRMRLGMIHQGQCLDAAPKVARCVQAVLGWDENRTAAELKALTSTLEEHLNYQTAVKS